MSVYGFKCVRCLSILERVKLQQNDWKGAGTNARCLSFRVVYVIDEIYLEREMNVDKKILT